MFDAWCMVPFFSTPPVDLLTSPGFEATGWGLRPVFGRITRGEVAPAPAWCKETKGIIATYMALVLRSPWKLNTTWRFRTISDLTAMDVIGNVEHEPQTWFSYVFIIFIHSIQWNPLVHACFHHQFQSKALGWKNFQQKAIWLGSVSMVDHQTEKPTQSVRKHHGSGVQLLWQTWNFHVSQPVDSILWVPKRFVKVNFNTQMCATTVQV